MQPQFRLESLLMIAWLLIGCGQNADHRQSEDSAPRADAKTRVTPIKPVRKTLIRYAEQPGQVAALERTPLLAKVSGYVRKIYVDIGDEVHGPVHREGQSDEPGQLLVELDVPELQNELAQKESAIKQVEAEIVQAKAAVKVAQAMQDSAAAAVEEVQASIDRAQADYDRWEAELARIIDLASREAVTAKLVDETKSKARAAEAARKEIAAKVKSSEASVKEAGALREKAEADLMAVESQLAVTQAERDRVQTLVGFAEIRAPYDGRVSMRGVDVGHLVAAGTSGEPLLVIVNTSTVRVFLDVAEADAVHIQPKAETKIRLPSLAGELDGQVTRTTWVLNESTRTLRVEIDVANDDGKLRPGMYAHARLKVTERPDVLALPKIALMAGSGQTSCWVIEPNGTLRRQTVQTGIEAAGETEIVSGLTGDENIIGVNAGAFREGQQVEVVEPQ
jgi:multidrug efflux pump subunit AcrA (membrane-fusion protein)